MAVAATLLFVGRARAFSPPPLPADGFVVDTAGKLSASDIDALDRKLRAIKQAGGPSIAALVTGSLEGESIDDVGYETARVWKVGEKGADNGVLIVIAPNERKVRIEVAKGNEGDLTDLESNDIIRQ